MQKLFSLSLFIYFLINCNYADPYLNPNVRKVIGKVQQAKGNVVLHHNQNSLIQYASKNTLITNDVFIQTRNESKVKIMFKKNEYLTLGQNTKVYLSPSAKHGRISVKLIKGKILIQDLNPGDKNIIANMKGTKFAYSGNYLAMKAGKNKPHIYTSKGNRVYRYHLDKQESLSFTEEDLQDLLVKKNLPKEVPKPIIAKNETISPKTDDIPETTVQNAPSIENELEQFFGVTASNNEVTTKDKDSTIEDELENLFGDDEALVQKKNNQIYVDDDSQEFEIDLNFLIRGTGYLSSPKSTDDVDDTPFALESRLGLGNKTIIGGKSSITSAGWVETGLRKKTYASLGDIFDYRKEKRSYISLNEFFFQLNLENSDLTVGKKVYRTGKGMIFSPSDRITPKDTLVPTDPLYLGNFLASYDLYIGIFDFSFVVLPFLKPNRTPPPFNRWTVLPQGANFKIRNEFPSGFNRDNIQSFFKAETTLDGWDLALSVYNGPNTDPVVRNDIDNSTGTPDFTLVQEYIPVTNISFGFSTTFQRLEIHGEILKQNASEGRDDSYTTYVIGGYYTIDEMSKWIGIDKITTILELTDEIIHKNQTYPFYVASSSTSRIFQESLVLSTNVQFNEDMSFNHIYHKDIRKKGLAQIFAYTHNLGNSGKLTFKYEQFSGTGNSVYAIWGNNDNISTEYQYNF